MQGFYVNVIPVSNSPVFPFPVFLGWRWLATNLAEWSECERLPAEIWCIKKITVILKLRYFTSSNYFEGIRVSLTLSLFFLYIIFSYPECTSYEFEGSFVFALSRVEKQYIPLRPTSVSTFFVTVMSLCSPLTAPVAFHGCQSNQFMIEERPRSLEIVYVAWSALPSPHGLFKKVSLNFLHVVLLGCTKYWQCFIISSKSLLCALVFIVLPLIIVNSLSVFTQIRQVIPKTVLFMKLSIY